MTFSWTERRHKLAAVAVASCALSDITKGTTTMTVSVSKDLSPCALFLMSFRLNSNYCENTTF